MSVINELHILKKSWNLRSDISTSFPNIKKLELMRWEIDMVIFLNWDYKLEIGKWMWAGQLWTWKSHKEEKNLKGWRKNLGQVTRRHTYLLYVKQWENSYLQFAVSIIVCSEWREYDWSTPLVIACDIGANSEVCHQESLVTIPS
jgi:hypothetical protein